MEWIKENEVMAVREHVWRSSVCCEMMCAVLINVLALKKSIVQPPEGIGKATDSFQTDDFKLKNIWHLLFRACQGQL